MTSARIAATARYLPPRSVENEDLGLEDSSWIEERTGIRSRRFGGDSESATTMAVSVVNDLLGNLDAADRQVDALIFSSYTAEYALPPNAVAIAAKAEVRPALAFDVNAACAGFTVGLDLANYYLRDGMRRIIVIGAEFSSPHGWIDGPKEAVRISSVFGDGAGGVVVERSDSPGIEASGHSTDPRFWDALCLRYNGPDWAPGYPSDIWFQSSTAGLKEGFRSTMFASAQEALERSGRRIEDMRYVLLHQPQLRWTKEFAKDLGATEEQLYILVDHLGNLGSASIPVCVAGLVEEGRLERGDRMLLVATGTGFTSTAHVLTY